MNRPPVQLDTVERKATSTPAPTSLLNVDALAERLGVTPRFVRRLVHERRVPFLKIGKFVRFDPREIDQWINDTRRPSIASAGGS